MTMTEKQPNVQAGDSESIPISQNSNFPEVDVDFFELDSSEESRAEACAMLVQMAIRNEFNHLPYLQRKAEAQIGRPLDEYEVTRLRGGLFAAFNLEDRWMRDGTRNPGRVTLPSVMQTISNIAEEQDMTQAADRPAVRSSDSIENELISLAIDNVPFTKEVMSIESSLTNGQIRPKFIRGAINLVQSLSSNEKEPALLSDRFRKPINELGVSVADTLGDSSVLNRNDEDAWKLATMKSHIPGETIIYVNPDTWYGAKLQVGPAAFLIYSLARLRSFHSNIK